jgi:hypothetical protein
MSEPRLSLVWELAGVSLAERRARRLVADLGDVAALAYLDGLEDGAYALEQGLEIDRQAAVRWWSRQVSDVARQINDNDSEGAWQ